MNHINIRSVCSSPYILTSIHPQMLLYKHLQVPVAFQRMNCIRIFVGIFYNSEMLCLFKKKLAELIYLDLTRFINLCLPLETRNCSETDIVIKNQ